MDSDSDRIISSTEEESLSDSDEQFFYEVDGCIIYEEGLKKLISSKNVEKKTVLNSLVTKIIEKNDRHAFKTLIRHGYKVDAIDATGQTALHLAFYQYHHHIMNIISADRGKMLFDCACEQNHTDKFGLSHFHIACYLGNLPIVEKYLQNKVDINVFYYKKEDYERDGTALHLAILSHRLKIVQLLIENGADINARDSSGRTCLHLAAISDEYSELSCWEDDLNIMKIFAANSYFINSKDNYDRTPIVEIFVTTFLIRYDTLYSKLNDDGTTLRPIKSLTVDLKARQMEKVKILLELGADITILHYRVLHDIVQDLQSVRCTGDYGVSFDDSLHIDTVKQIFSVWQNIDIIEKNILLQSALSSISFEMVKLLLDHGADIRNLKFAQGIKSRLDYPTIIATFECIKNVFSIIELMAHKGLNFSDEDNLVFLKLFLHDVSEEECHCSRTVNVNEQISCSEVLSFSMPNHLNWLWGVADSEIVGDLDIYWKSIKYAELYIAKEIEFIVLLVLKGFHPSLLQTKFVPNFQEVEYMKSISLRKNVSLHDILKMHPYRIYPYIAGNDFSFLQHFSQYENFIKGHITKSLIRHYFEESAYKYLEKWLTSLEYPCLRTIISYLSNEDIWAVSQAVVLGNSD